MNTQVAIILIPIVVFVILAVLSQWDKLGVVRESEYQRLLRQIETAYLLRGDSYVELTRRMNSVIGELGELGVSMARLSFPAIRTSNAIKELSDAYFATGLPVLEEDEE